MIIINYLNSLKERKYCYLAGFLLGLVIGFRQEKDLLMWIAESLGFGIVFGFLIYHLINNTDLYKKVGRYLIFTKEGMFHVAMGFSTMIIVGLLGKLLNIK